MLNSQQVGYLNSWYEYFKGIDEEGIATPPSYNNDDIMYWEKWYKKINKQAKRGIIPVNTKEGTVPFSPAPPNIKSAVIPTSMLPKKQKKQVATGISPNDYERQQESNFMQADTF